MMRDSYRVVAPDRFLSTRPVDEVVTIRQGSHVLVETRHAQRLLEGDRPEVTYVPLQDITGATLQLSAKAFHCRWKGEAKYYDVLLSDGTVVSDGAWAYPDAPEELAALQTRVAFDPAKFNERITSDYPERSA